VFRRSATVGRNRLVRVEVFDSGQWFDGRE
jgi:hypothetical protein